MGETETAAVMAAEISFGPKGHQVISPDVASMLLTLWRERQPAQFGAYLGEVMTGERPAAERKRAGR